MRGRRAALTVAVAGVVSLSGGALMPFGSADLPAQQAAVGAPRPTASAPTPAAALSLPAPGGPDGTVGSRPSPPFFTTVSPITPAVRARMGRSWRPGCPVPLSDLRYVQVSYWNFAGAERRGELVLNKSAVPAVVRAMHSLYDARFPILDMRLIDASAGADDAAAAARTTAAFNCRPVTGRPGVWSQHAYGLAIDINPVQNPYVGRGGAVEPPAAHAYVDRSRSAKGMIRAGDAAVRAFAAVGWSWGGSWTSIKDYQHFSATSR